MQYPLLFSLLIFPFLLSAQTGILEDFNDDALDPGWKSVPTGKYNLTEANQELEVDGSAGGWDNFEFNFRTQDISNNPVVQVKIRTSQDLTMRIDVVDENGVSNNSSAITQSISSNSSFTNYSFNFLGKFGSANASMIRKIVIFLNPGKGFNGTIHLDDVTIGDALPYFSSGPIRVNQVGYELNGPKIAIFERSSSDFNGITFQIVDGENQPVYSGNLVNNGQVSSWSDRYFWTADFSNFKIPGKYKIKIGSILSYEFDIAENILFETTAFSTVDFFKGMRHTGTGDRTLSFNGDRNDEVNVFGGWWDATGDPGKHISHLSYANYFNPQQIPMVVWSLLKSYELDQASFSAKATDLKEEAAWGADYLLRNLDPSGYFYLSIFDEWGNIPGSREICEWGAPGNNAARSSDYQCAFREGGGMAIAALARAYSMDIEGDSSKTQYLNGAIKAYDHLKSTGDGYATRNIQYCNDHEENIIDDYCALMAAVELYKATGNSVYLNDASVRAGKLISRQHEDGWFKSDNAGNRPFYHAADEGLPIISLIEYMDISDSKNAQILQVLRNSLDWYISISKEVTNPFNYLREYYKPYSDDALQSARKAFFVPHDNETGYWWQGENARLASMTTAFLRAARKLDPGFVLGNDSISKYAISQLDWILGKNPFDICMMYGFGQNTYPDYPVASAIPNIVGGICNGITASDDDENDIAWKPFADDSWENWRWIEQWLPHDAWYALAVSSISHINNIPGVSIAEFSNFEVSPAVNGVALDWATTSEINGSNFIIQKSSTGSGFTDIGTVDATGDESATTEYSFIDPHPLEGTSYYRLVFTDLNGNTITSDIETITISGNTGTISTTSLMSVAPNPFKETTTVTTNFTGNINLIITNSSGKEVERITSNQSLIQLGDNYSPGIYFIEVIQGEKRYTTKIVKRD